MTITQLKLKSNKTPDAINLKNAVGKAGSYADALYNLITWNFSLDGKTSTVYTNFMDIIKSLKG